MGSQGDSIFSWNGYVWGYVWEVDWAAHISSDMSHDVGEKPTIACHEREMVGKVLLRTYACWCRKPLCECGAGAKNSSSKSSVLRALLGTDRFEFGIMLFGTHRTGVDVVKNLTFRLSTDSIDRVNWTHQTGRIGLGSLWLGVPWEGLMDCWGAWRCIRLRSFRIPYRCSHLRLSLLGRCNRSCVTEARSCLMCQYMRGNMLRLVVTVITIRRSRRDKAMEDLSLPDCYPSKFA